VTEVIAEVSEWPHIVLQVEADYLWNLCNLSQQRAGQEIKLTDRNLLPSIVPRIDEYSFEVLRKWAPCLNGERLGKYDLDEVEITSLPEFTVTGTIISSTHGLLNGAKTWDRVGFVGTMVFSMQGSTGCEFVVGILAFLKKYFFITSSG